MTFYLAYRKLREIFRSGETTISDAVRKGTACWALDEEHLLMLRARGISFVGVLVKDTGDLYMTLTPYFFDRTRISILNYEARGGALQRYLPLENFRCRPGRLKKL